MGYDYSPEPLIDDVFKSPIAGKGWVTTPHLKLLMLLLMHVLFKILSCLEFEIIFKYANAYSMRLAQSIICNYIFKQNTHA